MKNLIFTIAVLAIFVSLSASAFAGFYTDVTSEQSGNHSDSAEAGSQSESNYGYQHGNGI